MVNNAYWNTILSEYANKHNKEHNFLYTGYGLKNEKESEKIREKTKNTRKKKLAKKYGLGEQYPGVYITSREYDCITQLLKGKTIKGIAKLYDLSPRTVEFYIKNVKVKMNCSIRDELIEKISKIKIEEII